MRLIMLICSLIWSIKVLCSIGALKPMHCMRRSELNCCRYTFCSPVHIIRQGQSAGVRPGRLDVEVDNRRSGTSQCGPRRRCTPERHDSKVSSATIYAQHEAVEPGPRRPSRRGCKTMKCSAVLTPLAVMFFCLLAQGHARS